MLTCDEEEIASIVAETWRRIRFGCWHGSGYIKVICLAGFVLLIDLVEGIGTGVV
jgi:hypothetical protein